MLHLRFGSHFTLFLHSLAVFLAASGVARAEFNALLSDVHVHLTNNYVGGWSLGLEDFDNSASHDPAKTILYVSSVGQTSQPAGAQWNFIGAGAGNTYWRTPQNPASGIVSLSVAAEETLGAFTAYAESDPRVPATPLPWMKMSLTAVRGPGEVSFWSQSGANPSAVWVSSSQGGVDASDSFFITEGSHNHYAAGFTGPGYYELDFRGSGRIGSSISQSAVETYHVVVAPPVVATSLFNNRLVDFISPGAEHVLAGAAQGVLTPAAVVYDAMCNLYEADAFTGRVLKMDLQGNVTTFAGAAQGITNPTGIAVDPFGNVFVSNYLSNNIVKIAPNGASSVLADASKGLSSPFGLAANGQGDLFAADVDHARIVKINSAGVVTTFADGTDGLASPTSVALDSAGNLFVADAVQNRVMKFDPAGNGVVFADSSKGVTNPTGVSTDVFGNLYIADKLSNSIIKITPGGVSSIFASGGDGLSGPLSVAAYNPPLAPETIATLARSVSVPEPASWVLALVGVAWALAYARRRRYG